LYVGPQSDELVQYSITSATGLDSQSPRNVLTESAQIVLTGQHPVLGTISKTIILNRSDYRITVTGEVAQAQGIPISLEWTHVIPLTGETARLDPWQFTLLDSNDNLSKVVPSSLPTAVWTDHPGLRWFSFGDRYFTSALLGSNTGSLFKIGRADSLFSLQQTGDVGRATFNLYSGPKEKAELLKAGGDLKRAIDLGFFTFLADPLLSLLRFFNGIFGNYGIAIILLTLSVKLAFYPLTAASFKSMQKMQEIQPEMQRLREKHKDATELNQAVMELYKRKGVNPLGGCLPVLVQIPVFFGLYNALLQSIELRHQPFAFWIHDLSSPEKLVIAGIPVPLMIIIMGLTMIWQQWTTPSAADPQQKKIMMMMPVIFTIMFILFPMPAGLVLYWLVSNIMGITQQVYLRNAHGTHPLVATLVTSIMLFIGGYVAVLAT
jgi:YidC/Oxa1 family membrane protein insertase